MKKLKFIALALFFASFCLVACQDPDPINGGGTEEGGGEQGGGGGDQGGDQNGVDLTKVNFMEYAWKITKLECPDVPEGVMVKLQNYIRTESLMFDNFGITGSPDYKNWGMNLSVNVQSQYVFWVEYYRMTGGKHLLSFKVEQTVYTGEIVMSQYDSKIYATFTGKSADGSKQTMFACYITK